MITKVHKGTVRGDGDLCGTCRWCHRYRPANGTEDVSLCTQLENQQMPAISECNQYSNASDTSLRSMYEIAWELGKTTSGRVVGFMNPKEFRKKVQEGKIEEPDDIKNPLSRGDK